MGYTEQVCQICGVPFNIGREPELSAWRDYHYDYITEEDTDCKDDGCSNVLRHPGADEAEHLAGPECTSTSGYSGWRISVEEIQDRNRCLCLAQKKEDWKPEIDDHAFEIESEYCYLTGISSTGVSDFGVENLTPARHGLLEPMVDNNAQEFTSDQAAMPMHPACFEMFKRESVRIFGYVNIDGLWKLRETQGHYSNRFKDFPIRPDLEITVQQMFNCVPGTEYLASDPIRVNGLSELIRPCQMATHAADSFVFERRKGDRSDVFGSLPLELQQSLLEYLDRRSVANLRLASKVFSQVPQLYFKHLVRAEMPWLWELDEQVRNPTDWHALWLKLASADGGDKLDEKHRNWQREDPNLNYEALRQKLTRQGINARDPRWNQAWMKEVDEAKAQAEAEIKAVQDSGRWDDAVKLKATEIRGLRNRRRIYEDLQLIMERIRALPVIED
ncbi:hypothetical protein LTR62_000626 [Meristemomyces frigidus]|uniref:F-box domain-containing protein n=1 Tax=Meristemomyces frigidus TaxID=1508187 RepID=A0AAN7T964_9PEZI|nr:hypothetical protein LTR62_000626 [Meristemomyces frigidus]